MVGTLVNTGAVVAGSAVGIVLGRRLPERIKGMLSISLGLAVLYVGVKMALDWKGSLPADTDPARIAAIGGNLALLVVGSVILGGVTGEILGLEKKLAALAVHLKRAVRSGSPTFVEGFVTASVMYLVGPMTILGCFSDGLVNDPQILYIKSIFDGVASVIFASSLGVGVLFSAISVLVVQGALTLGASYLTFLEDPGVLAAITATGGVLILSIGMNLLEIRKIPTGNLLPALAYAVIIALL